METPYTFKRDYQFRGPTDSGDYNERIETEHQDLSYLYNALRMLSNDLDDTKSFILKNQTSLGQKLEATRAMVDALANDNNIITMADASSIDVSRFDSTAFSIQETDRCTFDARHRIVTLPEVADSSLSKLVFFDGDGNTMVPSSLEMRVEGVTGTADSPGAIIDSNEPEIAVAHPTGRVWERNVVVSAADENGAEAYVYVKAPTDLFTTEFSNCIVVHPFPMFGLDLLEVAYTTNADVLLDTGDGYTPLNVDGVYGDDPDAVGWVPPGGWNGDEATQCGPKIYHFDPKRISGVRLKIRQSNYYVENTKYVYTYGLSLLDLRYNKFLNTGKTIIRFDAPDDSTISGVTNVIPQLWNVPEAIVPSVFSYRVIWETAYNSGVYTLTPVPESKRVWVEVSLTKTPGGSTPALSGLSIETDGL